MDNDNYDRYELLSKSLREHLVPVDRLFQYVQELECIGKLEMHRNITDSEGSPTNRIWVIPYAYKVPACVEVIRDKNPKKTTITMDDIDNMDADDIALWSKLIQMRLNPYIASSISEEALQIIDSNREYGVILHMASGEMEIFNYTDLVRVEVGTISAAILFSLVSRSNVKNELDENQYQYIMDAMYNDRFKHDAWISIYCRDDDGNEILDTINVISSKTRLSSKEVSSIVYCVKQLIANRAKVIMVP